MKKYSFREAEAKCEATFSYTKHDWWHLYTLGKETSIIFSDDDDYRYSMNQMAKCSSEFPELAIVAFELMSNHLHIVLTGEEKRVNDFSRCSATVLFVISLSGMSFLLMNLR